jgi:hypothetical protein
MTIYTPITPTYLYIKQHSITGLKYFGKTTKDPYTYNGSGKHWTRHIKKHGKEHIITVWVSDLFHDKSIVDYALQFSKDNNIVESKEWANLKPENGLDGGGTPGIVLSYETRIKMSKPKSDETKAKMSAFLKGKPKSDETKAKISATKKGLPSWNKGKKCKLLSDETKAKMSFSRTGKKQLIVVCPHCNTSGGAKTMPRWHFNNCSKLKK